MSRREWPPYFQPGDDTETAEVRIPASILDIFYLRSTPHTATHLIVVAGCIGGHLDVFTGDTIHQLPELLAGQVQAIQASRRNQFRLITAQSVDLFTLEAMEQEVQAVGFNDAVYLFGHMQARIESQGELLERQHLQTAGRLTVGRLDLLYSFCESVAHVFTDPHNPNEHMYQLLIPAGPATDIQQGKHLALLYPILDPQLFERAHNTFLVMRLAYDLLLALQQDMLQANSSHSFVRQVILVPSRKRLAEELERDGYEVKGDVAIKKFQVQPEPGQIQFLIRLRQAAQVWLGERINLPSQATPAAYKELIAALLEDIATTADKTMMAAMLERVAHAATPTTAPTPRKQTQSAPRQIQPPPVKPTSPPARPARRPANPQAEWASDFDPPQTSPRQKEAQDWAQDFAEVSPAVPQKKNTVTSTLSDWAVDETTEHEKATTAVIESDWAKDFES